MDMEKRMQKAHISKYEIPLLGFDVGGITVKLTYFDIDYEVSRYDELESNIENAVNVNFAADKMNNRKKLKQFLNDYLKKISLYTTREFLLKDIEGFLHCYLFNSEKLNEFMEMLSNLRLQKPFFVLTGTALVNYISKLEEQFNARIMIIPSENESLVRGVEILHNQKLCQFFYEIELKKNNGISNIMQSIKPNKDIQTEHFYPCLLVIIGTSTIYLKLNSPNQYTHLSTSAISGQSYLGICNAANNLKNKNDIKTFNNCIQMATEGHNDLYDVTIKQMCDNNDHKVQQYLFLHNVNKITDEYVHEYGELPITVFGKINPKIEENKVKKLLATQTESQMEINNFAAATLNMICYQIAETICLYSKLLKLNVILCSGSFLATNSTAKMLITKYVTLLSHNRIAMESKKKKLYFTDNEAYLGAIGCISLDSKNVESSKLD